MVRNPSGEGGDVELGARTLEKFSVFAFGLLALTSCFTFIALITCSSLQYSLVFIHLVNQSPIQQDCIVHLKLVSRGITRKEFRALQGNSASSLVLGDCCIINF